MVAAAGDYRKPAFNWFHQKGFGHYLKYNDDIIASSFAMVGKKDFCFKDKLVNVLVYSTASTDYELCFRKESGLKPAPISEAIFNHYHNPEQYGFDECGANRGDQFGNFSSGEVLDPINEFDPFSIIDPKHWNLKGSNPIPRGANKTLPPQGVLTSHLDFLSCDQAGGLECETGEGGIYGEGVKYRVIKKPWHLHTDLKSLTIPLQDCIPLPSTEFTTDGDLCSDQNSTSECDLLSRALLLDEDNMPPDFQWKMEILDLISEIYGSICPAFSKDSAATVGRLFSFYLTKAGMNASSAADATEPVEPTESGNSGPKKFEQRPVWSFLMDELNTCKLNAKPMKFTWTFAEESDGDYEDNKDEQYTDFDLQNEIDGKLLEPEATHRRKRSAKSKTAVESQKRDMKDEHSSTAAVDEIKLAKRSTVITEKHLKKHEFNKVAIQEYFDSKDVNEATQGKMFLGVPENVKVDGHKEPLFYYEEAAENKYEFNLAIDLEWKIFGTVIGYCNSYYKERKAETFPRLYNTFLEDFLEIVVSDWKSSRDNSALRVVMSEFLSEAAHIWADSCFEASYIVSKSPTYRPPRPITIGGGSLTNYFTKLPEFFPQLKPEDFKHKR